MWSFSIVSLIWGPNRSRLLHISLSVCLLGEISDRTTWYLHYKWSRSSQRKPFAIWRSLERSISIQIQKTRCESIHGFNSARCGFDFSTRRAYICIFAVIKLVFCRRGIEQGFEWARQYRNSILWRTNQVGERFENVTFKREKWWSFDQYGNQLYIQIHC